MRHCFHEYLVAVRVGHRGNDGNEIVAEAIQYAVWFLKRRSEAGGSLELNINMGHEVLWELT